MNKIGFWILVCLVSYGAYGQDAREISKKAVDVMKVESMKMEATLTILDAKGRERVRQLVTQTREFNGVSKTLLKFTAPADVKGTALLIYDYEDQADDMWIYLPALRKTRRIVSTEKGKSFMGSEFSNADMSIPNADDFTYKLLGKEELNGHTCWKIESRCINSDIEDENGYLRKVSWIEDGTWLCYKVEFYSLDDELFKIQSIADYKIDAAGHSFAYYMEMSNVSNQRRSVMKVDQYQTGIELPEESFSPAMLQR